MEWQNVPIHCYTKSIAIFPVRIYNIHNSTFGDENLWTYQFSVVTHILSSMVSEYKSLMLSNFLMQQEYINVMAVIE